MAMKINRPTVLVDSINRLCNECLLIFSSTDLVYEGENPPYHVDISTPPGGKTQYGITKSAFESDVLTLKNGIIFRLSNMIGPKYQYEKVGCKFLQFLTEKLASKEYLGLFHDQVRSFVYVKDVANLMCKTVDIYLSGGVENFDKQGIYNVGGPSGCSRVDLARDLCAVTNTPFAVHDEKKENFISPPLEANGKTATWTVFNTSNSTVFIVPGVQNPRDVTMDSSRTEEVFNLKFKTMREAIALSI